MMTDPIADMLTRIRNGAQARKESVAMPSSRLKVQIAELLKKELTRTAIGIAGGQAHPREGEREWR